MRHLAAPAQNLGLRASNDGWIVALRSLRASGTVEASRTLSNAMPICRIHVPPEAAAPQQEKVRLSRFVVARRIAPRAANDNRRPRGRHVWHWAVAIAVAPTLTAVLLLAGLF